MILPFAAIAEIGYNDSLGNTDISAYPATETFLFVYFDESAVTDRLGYLLGKAQCDPLVQ
jgi:hypothetical protein